MKRSIFAALICAAIVGGCGGPRAPSSKPSQSPTTPKTVQGHPCDPKHEVFQCILPPAPKTALRQAPRAVAQGVDFAWGPPSVGTMRAHGWRFGASYLSHDPGKNWTPARVASFHSAGIATVAVWETTAGRASQGCTAGRTDAFYAARQASELGNVDRPINFAIDFDASGEQVAPYFRCAKQVLGSRTGAYGGYYPLKYLCAHGLVGSHNWQTYAWSSGAWLPASCAPLEQYLNDGVVDYDRAIASDYGQWPYAPAKPASRKHLEDRIRVLHRELASHGCNRRTRQHERTGPVCKRWKREGDQRHHELGR